MGCRHSATPLTPKLTDAFQVLVKFQAAAPEPNRCRQVDWGSVGGRSSPWSPQQGSHRRGELSGRTGVESVHGPVPGSPAHSSPTLRVGRQDRSQVAKRRPPAAVTSAAAGCRHIRHAARDYFPRPLMNCIEISIKHAGYEWFFYTIF